MDSVKIILFWLDVLSMTGSTGSDDDDFWSLKTAIVVSLFISVKV